MSVHNEGTFESAIDAHLLANGYRPPFAHDVDLALDTGHLFAFIEATQPDAWAEYVSRWRARAICDDRIEVPCS